MNKKEAETLLILTNFLHDLWQGFKAMVLVGSCIVVIHHRFVLIRSMKGLHNGFMTHGR